MRSDFPDENARRKEEKRAEFPAMTVFVDAVGRHRSLESYFMCSTREESYLLYMYQTEPELQVRNRRLPALGRPRIVSLLSSRHHPPPDLPIFASKRQLELLVHLAEDVGDVPIP